MTDEIASFKVMAADIQEQEKPPSGDGHMMPAAILAWLSTDGHMNILIQEIHFNTNPILSK